MKLHLYTWNDGIINEVEDYQPTINTTLKSYTLIDGCLYDGEEKVFTELPKITSFYSHLGKVFLFNKEMNQIFYWKNEGWEEIKLLKNIKKNINYIDHDSEENIIFIKKLVISKDTGCCLDKYGKLWSFKIDKLIFNTIIECNFLNLAGERSVLDLVSGNDHFVALVGKTLNERIFKIGDDEINVVYDDYLKSEKINQAISTSKEVTEIISESSIKDKTIFRRESERLFSWKPFSNKKQLERNNTTEGITLDQISEINFDVPKDVNRFATQFCFVNLQNIIGKNEKDEDSSRNSDDSVFTPNDKKDNEDKILTEIFTWGNNDFGQLGCGDKLHRDIPEKINGLEDQKIIKIVSGGDHSLALTASGQLYVWGSNINGQLKQQNQEYFLSPFLFKVGYNNHIIDVDASQDCTTLLIGNTTIEDKYIIISGYDRNTKQVNIKYLKDVSGIKIEPGKGIFIKSWLKTSKITIVNNCIKYLSMIEDLTRISGFIYEKFKDKVEFLNVIKNLRSNLKKLAINSGYIVGNLHKYLIKGIDFNDKIVEEKMANDEFLRLFIDYYWNVINCYTYGVFTNLTLGDENDNIIERLCHDYSIVSRKKHINLKKIFQLASNQLPFRKQDSCDLKDFDDKNLKRDRNKILWKKYFTLLEIIDKHSESTYDLWQNVTSLDQSIVKSLKNDKRIHLYTINNPKLKDISSISTNPLKNLIGRSWIKLIIFNDCIVIIDKNDYILLEFPLIWIIEKYTNESNSNDINYHTLSIISPEYEFELDTGNDETKTKFLQASIFWYNYLSFLKLLSYHNNDIFDEVPPNKRFVSYKFTPSHQVFRNATYTGFWMNGKPNGQGMIVFPGGKRYKGNFKNGLIEGYGKLQVPVDNTPSTTTAYFMQNVFFSSVEIHSLSIEELNNKKYDYMEGIFKNGVLHGLAMIRFVNGDTYMGYFKNGHREGFGVNCQLSFGVGEKIYCGHFKNDMKHGYGVYSTNHEKYLGMWENDLRHGKGCQITIDGVYHEGIFDKDRFIRGQMIYYCENLLTTIFNGDFDKEGIGNGKGILHTSSFDYIEGYFQGNILSNELKITNAIYKRKNDVLLMDPILRLVSPVIDEMIIDINENVADVSERWLDLFTHFLEDHFKVECHIEELESLQKIDRDEIWKEMLSSYDKIYHQILNENDIINTNEDNLNNEKLIPKYNSPWNMEYYRMVENYFQTSINLPYHPINRLIKGVLEVFTFAYDKIGAHKCLYQQIVVELHVIIRRLYIIMRCLFPNLPSSENMYTLIRESKNDDSIKNFDNENNIPACNFIGNYFFIEGYAVLFTVFQMHCQEADQKYFERICFLNTFNDSKLSDMMGLSDYLRPSSSNLCQIGDTLPHLEYYKTAIHIFQTLSGQCNPVKKLFILEETFDDILKVCFLLKFINKKIYIQ